MISNSSDSKKFKKVVIIVKFFVHAICVLRYPCVSLLWTTSLSLSLLSKGSRHWSSTLQLLLLLTWDVLRVTTSSFNLCTFRGVTLLVLCVPRHVSRLLPRSQVPSLTILLLALMFPFPVYCLLKHTVQFLKPKVDLPFPFDKSPKGSLDCNSLNTHSWEWNHRVDPCSTSPRPYLRCFGRSTGPLIRSSLYRLGVRPTTPTFMAPPSPCLLLIF